LQLGKYGKFSEIFSDRVEMLLILGPLPSPLRGSPGMTVVFELLE
jgi:hypothetical protein